MVMQRVNYAKIFQQKQTEWQTKAQSYNSRLQLTSERLQATQTQYQNLQKTLQRPPASDDESTVLKFLHTLSSSYMAKNIGTNVAQGASVKTFTDMNTLKAQITNLSGEYEKSDFYTRLYGQAPVAIATGKISSADDFMKQLIPPSNLTAGELDSVKAIVTDMIATINGSAPAEVTDVADEAVAGVKFPPLVPPVDTRTTPTTIHRLSVQDILKSLTAVPTPETTISDAEWRDYLKAKGYSDEDVDKEQQLEAENLIKEWQDRNNQIAAYKEGIATMPDYKASDILKTAILQPGLAAMEAANVYFTHVTQPVAGALYSKINPDLEAEYLRFKAANPFATDREAYVAAWNTWNPEKILGWELGPAQQWILKYMILEGLVDPTTYMGWGIATRIARPIPYVGRLVGAAERGFMEVMDLPFDAVKAMANNLPKSIAQRATLSSRASMQFADKYITTTVGKGLSFVKMSEAEKAAKAAIAYTIANPQLDNMTTRAGKAFLAHTPVTEDTAIKWSRTLGTTLLPRDITKSTVENLDNVFEDYFTKRVLTPRETAGQILKILNVSDMSDEMLAKAEGLLARRVKSIQDDSLSFLNAKNALQAMRNLGDRNFAIHLATEESSAYLSRKQMGAVASMIHNQDVRLQGVWQDYVDKIVIKPFAQAFLAFGMYGPMNVLEDYLRSTLGGVFPRRMTVANFDELAIGLSVDPNMRIYGLSEMLGEVTREGSKDEFNNWILQLAALGNKGWANKIYTGLVRLPGAYGMDLRRNFVAKRYLQILADLGGDQFKTLVEALPKNTSGLDLLNKSLRKDLLNDLYARVSTGDSKIVLGAKEIFTRENIIRQEVNNILMEHPELPPAVRQHIMQQFKEGNLFNEVAARDTKQPRDARGRFTAANDSITNIIKEARDIALDDFIKGPEVASLQFKKLSDFLTALEVQNPQEMATLVQSLFHMSEVYGALPEQIIAQATVRSRGLKLVERRSVFDADFERINSFLDSAGADINKVTDKMKAVSQQLNFPDEYRLASQRLIDTITAKREFATEWRLQNSASRHDYFAGSNRRDMNTQFWDNFYNKMSGETRAFNTRMAQLDGQIVRQIEELNIASGAAQVARQPIIVRNRTLAPNDIASLLGVRGDDISRGLLDVLTVQNNKEFFTNYVIAMTRPGDVGFTKEAVDAVYDQIAFSLTGSPEALSWVTMRNMELDAIKKELHSLYNSKLLPPEQMEAIGKYIDETAANVGKATINKAEYNLIRQQAMDEAHKWYYKEFVDYTNANVFDAMMKSIYPYWTYESQRWFWLPRSFVRHPGTFTSFERWQDNSDSGYVHIPNTSIDINPFRGTVYGTLTTRLARRDYPEYYDSLGAAKFFVEFNDFLSRYGFYAGAHIGILQSAFGGLEPQTGEILPGIIKTPLDLLVATFPKSDSVKWLSDHIFPDRFRDYTTIIEATKRGYSGINIWTKLEENRPLTEEEQNIWNDSRQESALYGALFEQTGLFRLKTEEQYRAYQESAKAIQDMTGYTPEQQEWLRRHGYKVWDMVGGISPSNQLILQQLESYKWIGLNTPLLPSRQQLELNRLNLDWQDIQTFTDNMKSQKLSLEQEFKNGTLGASEFNDRLKALYSGQREYIDNKSNENPLLTLAGRVEYYKKYGNPPPVQSPFKELLNLYFSIELKDTRDPETGELITDWKSFFANRQAIEDAIPAELKDEWGAYLSRNQTPIEELRRTAYDKYFQKYYGLWDEVVSLYTPDEQRLINEFLFLERTGQKLSRQEELKSITSVKTGNLLVSSFRSEISTNRQALRYSNPHLDAWLFYWGKTKSFLTPQAENIYAQIIKQTGRRL